MQVATVLTVYGIETRLGQMLCQGQLLPVATVLTVYGIETKLQIVHQHELLGNRCNSTYRLRY